MYSIVACCTSSSTSCSIPCTQSSLRWFNHLHRSIYNATANQCHRPLTPTNPVVSSYSTLKSRSPNRIIISLICNPSKWRCLLPWRHSCSALNIFIPTFLYPTSAISSFIAYMPTPPSAPLSVASPVLRGVTPWEATENWSMGVPLKPSTFANVVNAFA